MEKSMINPWKWQDNRSYVQAVEVKNVNSTLYVSGQAAVHADGRSSDADMQTQLLLAIENLEEVLRQADYKPAHIARLTIYTTSEKEFWPYFGLLQEWISKHEVRSAVTLMEVNRLFETLKVELEATAVK